MKHDLEWTFRLSPSDVLHRNLHSAADSEKQEAELKQLLRAPASVLTLSSAFILNTMMDGRKPTGDGLEAKMDACARVVQE